MTSLLWSKPPYGPAYTDQEVGDLLDEWGASAPTDDHPSDQPWYHALDPAVYHYWLVDLDRLDS